MSKIYDGTMEWLEPFQDHWIGGRTLDQTTSVRTDIQYKTFLSLEFTVNNIHVFTVLLFYVLLIDTGMNCDRQRFDGKILRSC